MQEQHRPLSFSSSQTLSILSNISNEGWFSLSNPHCCSGGNITAVGHSLFLQHSLCKVCKASMLLFPVVQKKKTQKIKTWKTGSQRDICPLIFRAALFIIAKRWKQPKCPLTDEWTNKMCYKHTMEYYLAIEKEGSSDTCCNMDEP